MSTKTSIEWTHVPGYRGASWNPVVGCSRKSSGCEHCYAEVMASRIANSALAKLRKQVPQDAQQAILHQRPSDALGVLRSYMQDLTPTEQAYLDAVRWEHGGYNGPLHLNDKALPQWSRKLIPLQHALEIPLKTKAPTAWFVNSMSDLFHESVPFSFIDQVMAVCVLCPQHLNLFLTKRADVMAAYWAQPNRKQRIEEAILQLMTTYSLPSRYIEWVDGNDLVIPNVWLGTSVEDQSTADARIPHLLRCPAAVRFLSCEPLLGPVDLRAFQQHTVSSDAYTVFTPFHWVIAGGESGPKARPMHPDWARGLRDQCQAAGVPFFFKQWGEWIGKRPEQLKPSGASKVHEWNGGVTAWKVGKRESGRLLYGVEHNGWPEAITEKMVKA